MADVSSYSHKLRTIKSDLFPRLQGGEEAAPLEDLEARMLSDKRELGDNVIRGVAGLKVNVRPHPENEDRIKNDISEHPAREKNTNIVKERRRKKGAEREKRKNKNEKKPKSPVREENKEIDLDPNVARAESNHVIGVFVSYIVTVGAKSGRTWTSLPKIESKLNVTIFDYR